MNAQQQHDIHSINQLLHLCARGIDPKRNNVKLVFEATASLGALSEDNEGVNLILASTSTAPTPMSGVSLLFMLLKWSINGGGRDVSHHGNHTATVRQTRTWNSDASHDKFYNDRTTTVCLRLLYNVIQYHLNIKLNQEGILGVRRIVIATGMDKTIEDISAYLIDQLRPNQSLCPAEDKPNFDVTLLILSRTCELESVRCLWIQRAKEEATEETTPGNNKDTNATKKDTFNKFAHKDNNDEDDEDEDIDLLYVLVGILEAPLNLTPTQYCSTMRIVNLVTKWHAKAKEKAIPCIKASVGLLETFHDKDNAIIDGSDKEKLVLQCFGMLSAMAYKCVPVQEELLESGVGHNWSMHCFMTYHDTNPTIAIQCLGFLASFISSGGPKAALSMLPVMMNKEFLACLLNTCQMYPRREQIQRLAINVFGLTVALVLCDIKENDVDSDLSDQEEAFSENDEDVEGESKSKSKPRATPRDILFAWYIELNVLAVCDKITARLKMMEATYERKQDESKKKYFEKTHQSIALIEKFYTREKWKRENPDSDEEE